MGATPRKPTLPPPELSGKRSLCPPAMRQQFANAAGAEGWQARQYIFQVSTRIVAIEFGRLDQAHEGGGTLSD